MKPGANRNFLSLLMMMVILAGFLNGFCQSACATELSGDAKCQQSTGFSAAVEEGCPSCPADEHSGSHHCDSCCNCPCHAPLTEQPVQLFRSLQLSALVFFEPFTALPEVFLSKFIPPQNLA
jgi:hypothetical protein